MLDLNFVRENFDAVRRSLEARGFPADILNRFAGIDEDRRRVIGEADAINQQRNVASKEIGALMQAGKRDEAEASHTTCRAIARQAHISYFATCRFENFTEGILRDRLGQARDKELACVLSGHLI